MANKQVTIEFKADDKGLVDHLKKLDQISKSLTQTQNKLQDSVKKEVNLQDKRNKEIKKIRLSLKSLGLNFKKVGISTKTYTAAVHGNKIALARLKIQAEKHIHTLKKVDVQTKKSTQRTRILGGTFAVMRSKMLLFNFAMGLGIRQLGKFGSSASKVESMSIAFDTLSGGTELASDALDKLEIATNNTMSQFDLFQQANNAMILGVSRNSDEMAEMLDIAQRLDRALGRDTASSVESLVTGIGRQ